MRTWDGRVPLQWRAVGFALCALAIPACEAAPAPLDWEIEFASADLRARAALVDARILRGGCSGDEVFGVEIRAGARMTPVPPSLTPGTWGFVAAAHDASCRRFAYDCVVVDLPGERRVRDTLAAAEELQICVPPQCRDGGCRSDAGSAPVPDAATFDAPTDAGAVDAPVIDELDAPRLEDSAGIDAFCARDESRCTDGIDDDCDGMRDCADTECSGLPVCDRCTGVMCPECQGCNPATGACDPVDAACPGGTCVAGSCCTGCVDSGRCVAGTADAACGSAGGACTACGDCRSCAAGSCGPAADGVACAAGAGTCRAMSCCTGCFSSVGAACRPGMMTGQCGFGGGACDTSCPCMSGAVPGGTCAGGEGCGDPIDISALGTRTVPIDTCGRTDDVDAFCGMPGGPDVVLAGDWPATGAAYEVRVPRGWVITYLDPTTCGVVDPGCFTSYGVGGARGFDGSAAFGIEREDGMCGRVNVTVTRSM